ncbi:hypothetical protein E1J38_001330 [Seonamhaeicola sediminis]|uniref:Glycoside hydrolase family 88 protein n=1 Tax=Seonamhaeicola sediminis TaxID=2528206 RepID=A0A562YHU1_9FLAO|nr:glycoside hydrolase family 88 protein [Seonamhaeicola sediminis]TWO34524.1 hypothetical protein E1J38_001330 [Seonamhaeicola sediminis]
MKRIEKVNLKKMILVAKIMLILVLTLHVSFLSAQVVEKPTLDLKIKGKSLIVEAMLPDNVRQFELRIESSRNKPMTRFSSVSPFDPDSLIRKTLYNKTDHETWFPVVDISPELGMEGVCVFKGNPTGTYTFGGPYYDDSHELKKQIIFPSGRLEHWENSLRVSSKEIEIEHFYLRKIYPVLLKEFRHEIALLSEDWSGSVSIFIDSEDGPYEFARKTIAPENTAWKNTELEQLMHEGLSKERLITSLSAVIDNGLRRQNLNPDSPTYGSFFTFYDLEARLHRSVYWLWGGSPIVKMVLDAIKVPEIANKYDTEELIQRMDLIGKLYLKYQVREENHPSRGSFLVIWLRSPSGYEKWVGTSDSGIMYKWALAPLYETTGDSAYVEAANFWNTEKGKLIEQHDILPHNYLYDINKFHKNILDETGWDPEGHSVFYRITGDESFKEVAKRYMDKHMAKFQNDNGLWNRSWSLEKKMAVPPLKMTRGTGWTMEGMLAMNEMFPDTIYLEYAKKLADQLVENQNPDGSWNFVFDSREGDRTAIPTDKGTPLWSLLMYRIYETTNNVKYLESARKALTWCLENQYLGPDPEAIGSIVGRTNASMVGYRFYYDATCAYSTGFFGLAILKELELQEKESGKE